MSTSKIHYFSMVFCLISLLILGGVAYSSVNRMNEINIPLEDKLTNGSDNAISASGSLEYNINRMSNSRFFRVAVEPKKRKIIAKKTSLKLKLEGIIAAESEDLARAIIRTDAKRALTYKLGDNIRGTNAELSSVEGYRVLIDRAGVLESLELDREKIQMSYE